MKFPLEFRHLILETFTRLGGRLLALVLLIWLVVLLINISVTLDACRRRRGDAMTHWPQCRQDTS
jgi:hypothetical protein